MSLTQWFKESGLKGIAEMSATGVQWTGWQWVVYLTDKLSQVSGVPSTRVLFVPLGIAANELICCQIFGRKLDDLERYLKTLNRPAHTSSNGNDLVEIVIDQQNGVFSSDWNTTTRYLKTGLSSTAAGITFDTIDNIVSAACLASGYGLASTLALRCLSVLVADRIMFNLGCELFDRIKLESWGQKFKANAELSINAGTAAVGYDLSYALADFICDSAGINNELVRAVVHSPFIFLGTAISVPSGLIEKNTIWKCIDYCKPKPTSHSEAQDIEANYNGQINPSMINVHRSVDDLELGTLRVINENETLPQPLNEPALVHNEEIN